MDGGPWPGGTVWVSRDALGLLLVFSAERDEVGTTSLPPPTQSLRCHVMEAGRSAFTLTKRYLYRVVPVAWRLLPAALKKYDANSGTKLWGTTLVTWLF